MIVRIETALVADDDVLMREFVVETLTRSHIQVTQVSNGIEARRLLEEKAFDLTFLDLKMPGMDGMQVLKFIKTTGLETLPIIVTAFGTVEKAVEAMKMGAYDFLMKPFSPEQVEIIIKRAKEWVELQAQNEYLQEELGWKLPKGRQIIGQSSVVTELMNSITRVAKSTSTALIIGESGTGKELVARAIHALSDRKNLPFIRTNCAAIPETLMDSELFGHEKGAFTGAINTRLGRFELANRGTLLLDEISEMPLGVQAKLLRVLQEKEFERVGGGRTIKVDCRIIATTNRDLKRFVDEGKFRHDLYYRLNVVPISVAPLRDRPDDIPLLANAFFEKFGQTKDHAKRIAFTPEAMAALRAYSWPGNVRELEHLVERMCVMEEGPDIGLAALPADFRLGSVQASPSASPLSPAPAPIPSPAPAVSPLAESPTASPATPPERLTPSAAAVSGPADNTAEAEIFSLPDIERVTILKALDATSGNRTRSAELLDISIRTLRNKLNEYREKNLLPEQYR